MPLPNPPNGDKWDSVEEMDSAYQSMGWTRSPIEWEFLSFTPKIGLIITKFRLDPSRLTCGCKSDYIYAQLMGGKIISTCPSCLVTTGPLSDEEFTILNQRRCSSKEGNEVISRTNQSKPLGLLDLNLDPMKNLRK